MNDESSEYHTEALRDALAHELEKLTGVIEALHPYDAELREHLFSDMLENLFAARIILRGYVTRFEDDIVKDTALRYHQRRQS